MRSERIKIYCSKPFALHLSLAKHLVLPLFPFPTPQAAVENEIICMPNPSDTRRSMPGAIPERSKPGRRSRSSTQKKSIFREYGEAILFAVVAAFIIKSFCIQAFRIPSASMEDSLLVGDFLLVNKFIYGAQAPFTDWRLPAIREPQAGDVIVFQYPQDPTQDYIKRCVAVEGQTVEIKDKKLFVDGKPQPLPAHAKITADPTRLDNFGPFVVPPGHLFMMGDNRDNSLDSRAWGPLDKRLVRGKAFILYMSWQFEPGDPDLIWTLDRPFASIASFLYVFSYDLVHFPWRVRWTRIGSLIR